MPISGMDIKGLRTHKTIRLCRSSTDGTDVWFLIRFIKIAYAIENKLPLVNKVL